MTWLTDNPMPLFILGMMVQLVLGIALWQTGRGWIAIVMGVLGVGSLLALAYEIVHVSPTEEIADTLDGIADLLELNDLNKTLECIAPDATRVRSEASLQLRRVKIEEAVMAGDLRVTFDPPADPARPEAIATFNGRLKAQFLKDSSPYSQIVQRFRVWFRKQDGKWLVTNFELNPR
jgi:hypothetical protein